MPVEFIKKCIDIISIHKMNKFTDTNENLVAASDAFFPFIDGIFCFSKIDFTMFFTLVAKNPENKKPLPKSI